MTQAEMDQLQLVLRTALSDTLDEKLEDLRKMVQKHDETINGNGKEGLKEIVNRHDRFISALSTIGLAVSTALIIAAVIGIIVILVTHGQLGEPVREISQCFGKFCF